MDASQLGVLECSHADPLQALGQFDGSALEILESKCLDGDQGIWQHEAGGILGRREAVDDGFRHIVQHAIYRLEVRTALLHEHILQSAAAGQDGAADTQHTGQVPGQGNGLQAIASRKGAEAHSFHGFRHGELHQAGALEDTIAYLPELAVFLKGKAGQAGAAVKGIVTNGGNGSRHFKANQRAAVTKQIVGDRIHCAALTPDNAGGITHIIESILANAVESRQGQAGQTSAAFERSDFHIL